MRKPASVESKTEHHASYKYLEQGAQFNAEIIFRGDFEILQYGFVWSKGYNPTIENSDKIVLTGSPAANTFSVQTTTTLGVNVTNHVTLCRLQIIWSMAQMLNL